MANVIREDVIKISWDVEDSPLNKITKETKKFQSSVEKASGKAGKGFDKVKKAVKELDNEKLKKLSKNIDEVTKKVGTGLVTAAGKAAKALAGIGTAVGSAAVAGATMGVNYNAQMETFQTSFEVMTGSAEKAQQTVSTLQKMGASTPFEMTDLAETTQLLMNYGFTADDAISRMSMLGDISQGNADKMNSIATAYGQMSSAGKVSLEDVKQMIEAGFNPLQEISQTTGESMASLYDRISKGKISVDEITQSMIRSTSEGGRYFKSMEKQSKTFSGQVSTMKDNFNNMLGTLTKGLSEKLAGTVLPKINDFIGKLTDAFNTGGFSGMFSTLLQSLGPVGEKIQGVVDKVKAFIGNSEKMRIVKEIFGSIKTVVTNIGDIFGVVVGKVWDFATSTSTLEGVKSIVDGISSVFQWLADHLNGVIAAVKVLAAGFVGYAAVVKITTALSWALGLAETFKTTATKSGTKAAIKATAAQMGMNAALLTCPFTWVVVAIVALVAAIILLVKNWDKIKEVAIKCWNAIKKAFGKLGSWFNTKVVQPVAKFFTGLWDKIKTGASNVWASIRAVWSTVTTWISTNIIQPIVNFFTNLWYFIVGVASYIWEGICAVWSFIAGWVNTNVIQPVVAFFTNLWNKIKTIIQNVWNKICEVWGLISSWVSANIIQPVVMYFTGLWNRIKFIVQSVWNAICDIWGLISSWVNSNIIQPVVNFFTNLWNKITEIVSNVWNSICEIWGQISGWVDSNIIQPISNFFSGLWDKITSGVSSVKETITGAFQDAWDTVTGIWEGITEFFSKLWDGVKNVVGKIIGKGKEATGAANDTKAANNYRGGLISSPTLSWVGEKGAEMIIPLTNYKSRGLSLWERAGQMLGVNPNPQISVSSAGMVLPSYTPGSTVSTSSTSSTENNNYSPQFTLNLSGTVDRTTQRTVKNWIKEALQETFDGMGRTNPRLTEV